MRTIVFISLLVVSLFLSGTSLSAADKQDTLIGSVVVESNVHGATTTVMIAPVLTIDRSRTAVLIMTIRMKS
ncbi:MAG TPA: hypothetical protein VEI57_00095 [Nitrospirota bacterium]|nr:hypothetical protein [Nitrospirota bacterium]